MKVRESKKNRRGNNSQWLDTLVATRLLREKHSLVILATLYEEGIMSTADLIGQTNGHPAAVINTIRRLQKLGVLTRAKQFDGRHAYETRLTLKGMQLVETPLCHWYRLVRKWDRLP